MNIAKKLHKTNLGKYRVWLNRLQTYMSLINFSMLLYLYMVEAPMGLEWYIWIVIMCVTLPLLIVFDVRFVYPSTLKYSYGKNPGFQRLEKKVDMIMKKLELEYKQ